MGPCWMLQANIGIFSSLVGRPAMAAAAAISEKPLAVQIVYTKTLRRKLISEIQKFKLILAGGTDPQDYLFFAIGVAIVSWSGPNGSIACAMLIIYKTFRLNTILKLILIQLVSSSVTSDVVLHKVIHCICQTHWRFGFPLIKDYARKMLNSPKG